MIEPKFYDDIYETPNRIFEIGPKDFERLGVDDDDVQPPSDADGDGVLTAKIIVPGKMIKRTATSTGYLTVLKHQSDYQRNKSANGLQTMPIVEQITQALW